MKTVYSITICVILIAAVAGMQVILDRGYPEDEPREFHYIPNAEFFRLAAPHLAQPAADIYWIKAILYFGRRIEESGAHSIGLNLARAVKADTLHRLPEVNEKYGTLADMLKTVIALDPDFVYPYIFGGLFLSMAGGLVDEAIELLKLGEERFPDDWRFSFYLGFNYYFFRNDPVMALQEFIRAAVIPGRPVMLYSVIRTITEKESKQNVAESFLKGAVMTVDNEAMQMELKNLLKEIKSRPAMDSGSPQ